MVVTIMQNQLCACAEGRLSHTWVAGEGTGRRGLQLIPGDSRPVAPLPRTQALRRSWVGGAGGGALAVHGCGSRRPVTWGPAFLAS